MILFRFINGLNVEAAKTKAHATHEDVYARRPALWEKQGNDSADKYAKLGAKLHPWRDEAVRHP